MFEEISDLINSLKEKAMEAMLPKNLPEETKKEYLELSHKMSPKQLEEFGQKMIEAREQAREEFRKHKKEQILSQI